MKHPSPKSLCLFPARTAHILFLVFCFTAFTHQIFAQSKSSKVTIKALELKSTRTSDGEDNYEYRVNTWFNGNKNSNCIGFNNVSANAWHTVQASDQLRVSNVAVSDISVKLDFETEAWEDDGCDGNCSYDYGCWGGSDEAHCGKREPAEGFEMILYNMVPGNFNNAPNLRTYNFCGNDYQIKYLVNYSPPQPDQPTVKVNGTSLSAGMSVNDTNCNDPAIELTSGIFVSPSHLSHVEYFWEYRIGDEMQYTYVPNPEYCGDYMDCSGGTVPQAKAAGTQTNVVEAEEPGVPACCTVPAYILQSDPRWRTVPGARINAGNQYSTGDGKKFSLRSLPGLENITQNTRVTFRVTAYANGMTSPVSATSVQVAISPQSPKADPSNITSVPSCPLEPTGIVTVTGITSQFPDYKYILRLGSIDEDEFGTCNPNNGNCFPSTDKVGSNSGSTLTIPEVMPGTYTLFLLNSGGNDGFCPRRIGLITVDAIPDLKINENPVLPVDLTCYGVNEGRITVSIASGRPDNVTYKLDNLTTGDVYNKNSNTLNASASFEGLKTGNYTLTVSDGCTPTVQRTFAISQPKKLSATSFSTVNATCSDPGNGAVSITVSRSSGAFDREVSTELQYRLFKGETLYHQQDQTNTSIAWTDLQAGNYKLIVTEKGSSECNGVTEDFTIDGPDPLAIESLVTTDVSCHDGNNGSITATGKGGTGVYTYTLALVAGGEAIPSNTTGIFTGLKAGEYKLVVKNQITCNDSYTQSSIPIDQPQKLAATITKTDITCHNLDNGKITSVVGGGTPGYTYAWQYLNGAVWQALGRTGNSIDALEADTYRVVVTDSKGCEVNSNEVTIVNPQEVTVSSVSITDIKCFGETGRINPAAAGGTAPYTFLYATGSNPFTTFTATTPFAAGSYKIKVRDKNNCEFQYGSDVLITAPPSALSFTAQLSNYNGFNISCYGGSNGTATLAATGGNGGSYTGYQYAMDGGTFTTNPQWQNINAGLHSFSVKDARGCVVSQNITFTQTSEVLAVQLVEKVDVVCFGDKSGELKVMGDGGLSPYEYQINTLAYQTTPHFTQLEFGDYEVTVKDKNGCTTTATYTILSVNPPLEIETDVTDVNCFGGSDGAIKAVVTGGVSPFTYQWQTGGATDNISGLTQGTYTLTVTDGAGCKMDASATVTQPQHPLNLGLVTIPVCYGRTNGFITAIAEGGSSPYQYSIDNGSNFQTQPVFEKPAGSYVVLAKDNNGCSISASAQITIRNSMPEPNFLAATSRNAQDVIAIVDISVPKPDSITWVFDPAAIVVDSNPWAPALKFMEPGTYMVNMTGYFEGCDYTTIKSITVNPYDPNAEQEALPDYQPIQSLSVSPNPSAGEFDIALKLNKKYRVAMVVYDVLGVEHYARNWNEVMEVNEKITLSNASAGVYLLRVITETDARDVRIIINK